MIKIIAGTKGTGKTKIIIDMANDNVETAKGDIVFVTDTDRYMYSLRYQVRVVNAKQLKKADEDIKDGTLIGFIRGLLAGNHDIETLYIDGAHRMLNKTAHDMEKFFDLLKDVASETDTRIVLTVSEDADNLPEFLKDVERV